MSKKTKAPKKLKSRVTAISLSALYNLGNYQNIKYDITAEIADGESATAAFQELRYILAALKPIKTPSHYDSWKEARKKSEAERSEYEKAHMKEWEDEVATYNHRLALKAEAIKALDSLGGHSTFRDAKQTWESDDDVMF